jgi:hypothetical protein
MYLLLVSSDRLDSESASRSSTERTNYNNRKMKAGKKEARIINVNMIRQMPLGEYD